MRKLFAFFLIAATPALGNELSYWSLQSGPGALGVPSGPTPLYDHGIHGEGQIIAVLDTGVDYRSCYFAEPDGAAPPINTGSPTHGFAWENVVPSRRKIIAYDFLYSCDQFPGAAACDDPSVPSVYDKQGHGTHAAASAVGDSGTPIAHDYADAIATGAKLIVQDAGLNADGCTQRPGIGCPVNLTPILDQAYRQGARIHSNSWGDAQGSSYAPPTANYSQSAHDVDAFVWLHPDMLVVFNTGNFGSPGPPPASSLSAPGCAKNTLQVGGTRTSNLDDNWLAPFSLAGPTRDGRIKPDVVGPAFVVAGDANVITGSECAATFQSGTSWASPTIAGAAALVRQYYTEGFCPTGAATPANAFTPSAALLKATIIAAARRVPYLQLPSGAQADTALVPSYQQGFGFPVLGDALYFAGNRSKLRASDVALQNGLAQGRASVQRLNVNAGMPLKVVLVWTDPAGVPRDVTDPTPELVNDLDLRVILPDGSSIYGNDSLHPGQPDRLNNVEVVSLPTPVTGTYTIAVSANHLGVGPTQGYALVVTGDVADAVTGRVRVVRR
jgi:Subtilase family